MICKVGKHSLQKKRKVCSLETRRGPLTQKKWAVGFGLICVAVSDHRLGQSGKNVFLRLKHGSEPLLRYLQAEVMAWMGGDFRSWQGDSGHSHLLLFRSPSYWLMPVLNQSSNMLNIRSASASFISRMGNRGFSDTSFAHYCEEQMR